MCADQSNGDKSLRLKQKVACKSCGRTIELDEPVRVLRVPGAVQGGSTSTTRQKCKYCGEEHEYSSNEVANIFEGPAEE
jgi:hypothetical protein